MTQIGIAALFEIQAEAENTARVETYIQMAREEEFDIEDGEDEREFTQEEMVAVEKFGKKYLTF